MAGLPEDRSQFGSPILYVIAAAVLFSTGGLFIKLTALNAYELSFGRSLVAALTVAFITRRAGLCFNRITLLAALFYAAMLLLFVLATKLTTAANAIFLQYTAPIYVLILEPLLFKEKFRLRDLLVVGSCVCGMMLFFVGQLRPEDINGNLCALASGLSFALFTLLLRHNRSREANRASSVIYGNLLLALCTAPAFFKGAATALTARDALIILYLGVFQIGLAYIFFTKGVALGVRSLDASIAGYVEPVLNPVWVFLIVRETPSRWAMTGGAIILAAVITHTIIGARRRAVADQAPPETAGEMSA